MFDWIFSFFHLFLFIGVFGFGIYSLIEGNILRSVIIIFLVVAYYLLVLHKAVKKEIKRKRTKSPGNKKT